MMDKGKTKKEQGKDVKSSPFPALFLPKST